MSQDTIPPTPPLRSESASDEEAGHSTATRSLDALRVQLDEAQATITRLERQQKVDALLHEADTIDLEAARLLTERAIEQMDEPDVALAVADLRKHKPYLFTDTSPFARPPSRLAQERREATPSGALAPRVRDDAAQTAAQAAAGRALETGDRRALLEYMRLRRRP